MVLFLPVKEVGYWCVNVLEVLRSTIPSFLNLPLLIGHILAIETTCPQLWQRKGISQSLNFCFG